MANVNSDLVTNFVATPMVKNDSQQLHGVKRVAQGTIALAAGDLSATGVPTVTAGGQGTTALGQRTVSLSVFD